MIDGLSMHKGFVVSIRVGQMFEVETFMRQY